MPDAEGSGEKKQLLRFDFPPGAGPKEIAAAIEAARKKAVAEWARKKEEEEKRDDARRGEGSGSEAGG